MSYDGFVTHSVVHELSEKILGGKIDKIYQPESDEVAMVYKNLQRQLSAAFVCQRVKRKGSSYDLKAGKPHDAAYAVYADAQAPVRR